MHEEGRAHQRCAEHGQGPLVRVCDGHLGRLAAGEGLRVPCGL